jgi:hypothetical protein
MQAKPGRPIFAAAVRRGLRRPNAPRVFRLTRILNATLVAERLTRRGPDVVIIDREHSGRGSTASTSMLLWEIDRPLFQPAESYGFERAARAYLSLPPN